MPVPAPAAVGNQGQKVPADNPTPHLFSFAPLRTSLVDLTQEYSAMSGYGKYRRTHRYALLRKPRSDKPFLPPASCCFPRMRTLPLCGTVARSAARTHIFEGESKEKFKFTFKSVSPDTSPFYKCGLVPPVVLALGSEGFTDSCLVCFSNLFRCVFKSLSDGCTAEPLALCHLLGAAGPSVSVQG